jgi:hypothetical protein
VRNTIFVMLLATLILQLIAPLLVASPWVPSAPSSEGTRDPVLLLRAIGPLASTVLVVNAIFCIAAAAALLAGQINFPVLPVTTAVAALMLVMDWPAERIAWIVCATFMVFAVLGAVSRQWALFLLSTLLVVVSTIAARQLGGGTGRETATVAQVPAQPAGPFDQQFIRWLEARREARQVFSEAKRKFPVFVVAAQGGGIYAATATYSFLSGLDERCDTFAQHVFAISAVSGGAIGAALYHGGMARGPVKAQPCRKPERTAPKVAAEAVGEDHLSPLLMSFLADLFEFVPDRGRALERSFAASVRGSRGASSFDAPFREHWRPEGRRPALVLNTTWSEMGYRVAFAPFELKQISDGTLLSFADERLAHLNVDPTLGAAAVASSRFPGILPAYTVVPPDKAAGPRWNFVDGGYADASGAATALDIYRALREVIKSDERYRDVDLRLILLTSFEPEPDFNKVRGSIGRDTLAPATTLLKVRELLSKQAVTRAVKLFRDFEDAAGNGETTQHRGQDDWKIAVVQLQQDAFNLPLGWMISAITRKLVAALMGGSSSCMALTEASGAGAPAASVPAPEDRHIEIRLNTVRQNTCITESILRLISEPE